MSYEEGLQSITLVADSSIVQFTGVSNIGPGTGLYPAIPLTVASGFAKSGNTMTVTTQSAHGLAAGDTVVIAGGATTLANLGSFYVGTVPTTTTFTYTNTSGAAENALTTTTARRIPSTAGFQYRFVKPGSVSNSAALATAAATDQIIGVLQSKPQVAGQAATVGLRGVTNMVAGGTIAAGQRVVSDSVGRAVVPTTAQALTTNDGIALEVASTKYAVLTLAAGSTALVNAQVGDYITLSGTATTAANLGTFLITGIDSTNKIIRYANAGVVAEGALATTSITITPGNRPFNAVALASASTVGELIPVLLKA